MSTPSISIAPVARVVEPGDEADQGRLARAGRADEGDLLAGPGLEVDALERPDAPGVAEMDILEGDVPPGADEGVRPLHVLDLGLGVEEVERDLEADDLILERADRGADRLERLVDGRHIGHHDEQLADREAALQGVVGPVAQHERRADRGGHVHGEREHRLPHGQFHAGVDRSHALLAESAVLVALADERHDHPEHRQRLVDDRQGLALQALDVQQPGLDVLDVVADRQVEQGDDRHRQQGQSRVDESVIQNIPASVSALWASGGTAMISPEAAPHW